MEIEHSRKRDLFLRNGSVSRHSVNLEICSLLLTDEPFINRMGSLKVKCQMSNAYAFGCRERSIIYNNKIIIILLLYIIGHIARTKHIAFDI